MRIMRAYFNLGEWIRDKWKTQAVFAEKMGVAQGRVSKWLTAAEGISPDYQAKIRKLGYQGPWPQEEAKETPAAAGSPYVTASELAELRGAVKAHVEYWREGEGKVLLRLEELARKIEAIERRLPP
jgi:hypothetical protein